MICLDTFKPRALPLGSVGGAFTWVARGFGRALARFLPSFRDGSYQQMRGYVLHLAVGKGVPRRDLLRSTLPQSTIMIR